MPGVDLNLDLPSLSDNLATIVSKTVTALSLIEDDLAQQVTPSEINVNGALSMNGSSLTNVGSTQYLSGNAPSAAGSLYYAGGEFYMVDSTGVIQITANGSLNAGALGSIVGDYGGGNPALVSYNDSLGEFIFTEDTGVYADLRCDDVILVGSAGTVRLGVDAAITSNRQVIFKSLPTSGVSFLVYNSATSTVEDGATTPVTSMSIATLTVTNPIKHGDFQKHLAPGHGIAVSGAFTSHATFGPWYATCSSSGTLHIAVPLEVGERLKSVNFSAGLTGTPSLVQIRGGSLLGSATVNSTLVSSSLTPPLTWVAGDLFFVKVVMTAGQICNEILVTYDRP